MVVTMSLWFLQESQRSKDVEESAHSAEAQSVVDVAGSRGLRICEAHHLNEKSRQNSERMLLEEQDWTSATKITKSSKSCHGWRMCKTYCIDWPQECLRMEVSVSSGRIFIEYTGYVIPDTSSTAQGGGGSFNDRTL